MIEALKVTVVPHRFNSHRGLRDSGTSNSESMGSSTDSSPWLSRRRFAAPVICLVVEPGLGTVVGL
jgi:hypothetical protein